MSDDTEPYDDRRARAPAYRIPPHDVAALYRLALILCVHTYWSEEARAPIHALRFPAVEHIVKKYGRGDDDLLHKWYLSFVSRYDRQNPAPVVRTVDEALEDLLMCVFFDFSQWDFRRHGCAGNGGLADCGFHMQHAAIDLIRVARDPLMPELDQAVKDLES